MLRYYHRILFCSAVIAVSLLFTLTDGGGNIFFEVAYTSGAIFQKKNYKGYPIFSVQIIYHRLIKCINKIYYQLLK